METPFPKSLSVATHLIRCAQSRDHEGMVQHLQSHFRCLTDAQADPLEINRGLMLVMTAFTAMAFEGRVEFIARAQSSMLDALHEGDIPRKLEGFQNALMTCVQEQFPRDHGSTLFQRLQTHLAHCSLSEFRSLSVSSLASHFGYNPDHFTRKIKLECNRLPSEILQEERLRRAHKLLHGHPPRWTLQEIARQLGFQDHRYLQRLLKRWKETNPHREPAP